MLYDQKHSQDIRIPESLSADVTLDPSLAPPRGVLQWVQLLGVEKMTTPVFVLFPQQSHCFFLLNLQIYAFLILPLLHLWSPNFHLCLPKAHFPQMSFYFPYLLLSRPGPPLPHLCPTFDLPTYHLWSHSDPPQPGSCSVHFPCWPAIIYIVSEHYHQDVSVKGNESMNLVWKHPLLNFMKCVLYLDYMYVPLWFYAHKPKLLI